MSALARWFRANGHQVSGYDKTETPLTRALQAEGIAMHYADAVENIPAEVRENQAANAGGAHARHSGRQPGVGLAAGAGLRHPQAQPGAGRAHRRAATPLRWPAPTAKPPPAAWWRTCCTTPGVDAGAFLGGISVNLGSNLLLPASAEAPIVVEADEYDRSFLTLHPDVAIVTSTDADHLDIYGDQDALIDSFRQFVGQIKPGGTLLSTTRPTPAWPRPCRPAPALSATA